MDCPRCGRRPGGDCRLPAHPEAGGFPLALRGVETMDSPVRMVCGGCLRSVEVVPANGNAGGNPCPYCGEPIESGEGDREPGTRMTRVAADVAEARPGRSGAMPDWASTWSQGSFGSLGRFQLRERLGDGG